MNPLNLDKFYGPNVGRTQHRNFLKELGSESKEFSVNVSNKMPSHIVGPTQLWMEFCKQKDALSFAYERSRPSDMLTTFVYQRENGYRKFVVAHPEVYWWYYKNRPAEERCSYEVIPENQPCRLYLDLEFPLELNPNKNGSSMTNIFIEILCSYFLIYWGLPLNKYNIINFDSSNEEKFSRHLIFNIKDVAFKDNAHVGKFVKSVCNDIFNYITKTGGWHETLNYFDRKGVEQLLVETKHRKQLFVDTGVYTKNRHFRVYKSTKWGKRSYLTISEDSKYIPYKNGSDIDLTIFLDSLVSYLPNKKDLILLEFPEDSAGQSESSGKITPSFRIPDKVTPASQYPALDKYIQNIINPGKIRLCKYFETSKTLIYETCGYRFCENIGRQHKSNNVFLIVDLKRKIIYQKCYDPDCAGFKSKPKILPEEVCFQIDDENDDLLRCVTLNEDALEKTDLCDTS